jgi:hypothetical protein
VSAVGFVAAVVSAFFAIGIAVGVIGVVALGALRKRPARPPGPDDGEDGSEEDGGPPRWPGRLSGLSAHGG